MTRRRSVSSILGKPKNKRSHSFQKSHKKKKVPCYCNNCNRKLVLERTKLLHETEGNTNDSNEDESSEDESSEKEAFLIIQKTAKQNTTEDTEDIELSQVSHQTSTSGSVSEGYIKSQRLQIPKGIDIDHSFLPQRCVRYTDRSQSTSLNIESNEYNTSEQNTRMSLDSESNNESSYAEIFEDYSSPPYQANMDAEENLISDQFSWILLWIMNFCITYNIPETAAESLIKFMKIVLNEIGGNNFRLFQIRFT
jgi:hypothetical protein